MRDLDKTVAYDLRDLSDEQLKELLNWLIKNDKGWHHINFDDLKGNYLIRDTFCNEWDLTSNYNSESTNALTLFEPQFKQGDKVLWTDDKESWDIGFFITEYKDSIIVESYDCLYFAIEVKPYEEEIKVGDWVKNREVITKFESFMSKDDLIKITKPELIKLLEDEFAN